MSGWDKDPIIAGRPRWESDPALAAAAREPLIVLGQGRPVPELFRPPANPNSAGLYPLGRRYSVGDEATLTLTKLRGIGNVPRLYTVCVTKVDEADNRVEVNDGDIVWDLMGNAIKVAGSLFDPPRQFIPAELFVGKRWRAVYGGTQAVEEGRMRAGSTRSVTCDLGIAGRERLRIAAGDFDAFRVEGIGRTGNTTIEETLWLVPFLNFPLRWDRYSYYNDRGHRTYDWAERRELVSARQFAIER